MPNDGQAPPNDPQPGGRGPAPGNLRVVQAFVNSNYDLEYEHGAELLDSPQALTRWLKRRGLPSTEATQQDLERALQLREGLRALLIAKHEGRDAELDASIEVRLRLGADSVEWEAAEGGANAGLDLILAHAATAQLDGSWSRLKACKECSWAFYDHSRNSAGNWCSMKVCGGRVKQRALYARSRGSRSGQS